MSEKEINQDKVYTLEMVQDMYFRHLWSAWVWGKGPHPDAILAGQNPDWVPDELYRLVGKPLKKEQPSVAVSAPTIDADFDNDLVSKLVKSLLLENGSPAVKKETLLQWLDLATHQWWSKPSPLHCEEVFANEQERSWWKERCSDSCAPSAPSRDQIVRMIPPPIRYEVPLKEGAPPPYNPATTQVLVSKDEGVETLTFICVQ